MALACCRQRKVSVPEARPPDPIRHSDVMAQQPVPPFQVAFLMQERQGKEILGTVDRLQVCGARGACHGENRGTNEFEAPYGLGQCRFFPFAQIADVRIDQISPEIGAMVGGAEVDVYVAILADEIAQVIAQPQGREARNALDAELRSPPLLINMLVALAIVPRAEEICSWYVLPSSVNE